MPPTAGPELMERHIEYVQASVDKQRLVFLDCNRDYNWQTLSRILDKPVPDCPFPRVNDTAATERIQRRVVLTALAVWAALGGTAALVLRAILLRLWQK